jgi:hypothetical protein
VRLEFRLGVYILYCMLYCCMIHFPSPALHALHDSRGLEEQSDQLKDCSTHQHE